eukprot:184172_1
MANLGRWIKAYLIDHFGKESATQREFDHVNRPRMVQIVNIKERGPFEPETNSLDVVVSDGHVLIKCKILPQVLKDRPERFQKNVLIHLTHMNVQITCDFQSVYFVLTKMAYLHPEQFESVCENRSIQSVNHVPIIQQLLLKYRSGVSFTFPPDPNGPKHKLFKYKCHKAEHGLEAWRNEIETLDLNDLCCEREQKKSDKEEMDGDGDGADRFIGNTCDWLPDLYPNIHDAPLTLTLRRKPRPVRKPQLASKKRNKSPLEMIQNPSQFKKKCIVTEYKEDVEGPDEAGDIASGSPASWTSDDVLQCDMAVEKQQKEKESGFVFAKPMYSLTEKYKAKARMENVVRDKVKDSIVSVQYHIIYATYIV